MVAKKKKSNAEVQTEMTNRIVTSIKAGKLPWHKPWNCDGNAGLPTNIASKKTYRGINPLLLECCAMDHGCLGKWWGTYKQWEALGAQVQRRPADVKSGEWGSPIVFWNWKKFPKEDKDTGETKLVRIPFLKRFTVFNIDQVDGESVDAFRVKELDGEPDVEDVDYDRAAQVLKDSQALRDTKLYPKGCTIKHGGNRAYHSPAGYPNDYIRLPFKKQFEGALTDYYGTAFHELGHWGERRVGFERSEVAEDAYAMGELVAEMTSCFVSAAVRIPCWDDTDTHERYLAHWLSKMGDDPRFIFQASKWATALCDLLVEGKLPTDYSKEEQNAVEPNESVAA